MTALVRGVEGRVGAPMHTNHNAAVVDAFDTVVGHSARFQEVVGRARRLSLVDTPVVLQGETGVGKEVFAHAIHDGHRGREGPFVALNCGGIPRELLASELFGYVDGAFTGARRAGSIGKIEAAHRGTLFLDEIAEMPLELQPYLLRVLEGGEVYPLGCTKPRTVEFRLIAACNRDLRAEVKAGRFREDLYYRISVSSLRIPALRERTEDLPLLVAHFARQAASRHGTMEKHFLPELVLRFSRYSWPGNLRELRNVVEIMSLLADTDSVDVSDLPPDFGSDPLREDHEVDPAAAASLHDLERDVIATTLRAQQGNLTRVAKDLGISRSTLYLKVKRYRLDPLLSEVRLTAHHVSPA